MATIAQTVDGNLTVTLSDVEKDTLSGLSANELQEYVTLWLKERATQVFQDRFSRLNAQQQAAVLTQFRSVGGG